MRCDCGHPFRGSHYPTSDFALRCLMCECIVPPAKQRYRLTRLPTMAELREAHPQTCIETMRRTA